MKNCSLSTSMTVEVTSILSCTIKTHDFLKGNQKVLCLNKWRLIQIIKKSNEGLDSIFYKELLFRRQRFFYIVQLIN